MDESFQNVCFADEVVPAFFLDLDEYIGNNNEINFEIAENLSPSIHDGNANFQEQVPNMTNAGPFNSYCEPETVVNTHFANADTNAEHDVVMRVDNKVDNTPNAAHHYFSNFDSNKSDSDIDSPLNNQELQLTVKDEEEAMQQEQQQPSLNVVDYNDAVVSYVPKIELHTLSNDASDADLSPNQFYYEPATGQIAFVSQVYLNSETCSPQYTKVIDLTQESVDDVEKILFSNGDDANEDIKLRVEPLAEPSASTDSKESDADVLIVEPLRLKTDCQLSYVNQSPSAVDIRERKHGFFGDMLGKIRDSKKEDRRKQILQTIPGAENLSFEVLSVDLEKTRGRNVDGNDYENNVMSEEIDEIFSQKDRTIVTPAAGGKKILNLNGKRPISKKKLANSKVMEDSTIRSYSKRYSYVSFNNQDRIAEDGPLDLKIKRPVPSTKCDECGKVFKALSSLEEHKHPLCLKNASQMDQSAESQGSTSKGSKQNKGSLNKSTVGRPVTRAQTKRRAQDKTATKSS